MFVAPCGCGRELSAAKISSKLYLADLTPHLTRLCPTEETFAIVRVRLEAEFRADEKNDPQIRR
jgi:hypothetical protein